ncbi:MAG: outer membrane beta-barrel protein [Bacteroidetes bacterium]|nr:outer membrane beta-barrel protein [Bacteroidota bacterium]
MRKGLLLIFAFFPLALFSQSGFAPGFIIKAAEDTVRGYIEEITEKKINDKIHFTKAQGNPAVALSINDITAFGYTGGNVYYKVRYIEPAAFAIKERFAKKLVEGYYRLYNFWEAEKQYFVVNTYEDSTYLLYDDDISASGIVSEKGNFRNRLLFFSINCDSIKQGIERLDYTQARIAEYVHQLNRCILPSEQNAVVYKKDKTFLNIYGYTGAIPWGSQYEFAGRIIARLSIPSLDKNTFLNVGISYMANKKNYTVPSLYLGSPPHFNIDYRSIFSVPLTIQYNLLQGKVRPYVEAGLSIVYLDATTEYTYSPAKTHDTRFGIGFIVAAGVEGNITHRLMIKADWRYELFLHYPTLGIGYIFK